MSSSATAAPFKTPPASEAERLGTPARIVRRSLSAFLALIALVLTPVGWLLTPLHALLTFFTLGLYASVWYAASLPLMGAATATSRLWWKMPALWPAWLLLGAPFVIAAYALALLGPRWREGDERAMRLEAAKVWPYTYLALFDWGTVSYSVPTAAGAYDGLAPYEIGIQERRRDD